MLTHFELNFVVGIDENDEPHSRKRGRKESSVASKKLGKDGSGAKLKKTRVHVEVTLVSFSSVTVPFHLPSLSKNATRVLFGIALIDFTFGLKEL